MSQQAVTVIRLDTGQPFIASAQLVTNGDGSVSFLLPNGAGYAGQNPTAYGLRADGPNTQQYQRAQLNGTNAVTFYPLAEANGTIYPPYTYLLGSGTVYPA